MIYDYLIVILFFFIPKKYFYEYIDIDIVHIFFLQQKYFLCFCSENIN